MGKAKRHTTNTSQAKAVSSPSKVVRRRYRKAQARIESLAQESSSREQPGTERHFFSFLFGNKGSGKTFLLGMGSVLNIAPPRGEIFIRNHSLQQRLRESWVRTGSAIQLAMDEQAHPATKEEITDSKTTVSQAAML